MLGTSKHSLHFWKQIPVAIHAKFGVEIDLNELSLSFESKMHKSLVDSALSEEKYSKYSPNEDATEEELTVDTKIWLFRRLGTLLGLEFSRVAKKELLNKDSSIFNCEEPLDPTDLIEIHETLKVTNTGAHAQGFVLKTKAKSDAITKNPRNSRHLNKLAIEKFEKALELNTTNKLTLRNLAETLHCIGKNN